MAKYHFDIRIADCFIRDSAGSELPDDRAALAYARQEIRELLTTGAGGKIDLSQARIEVGDAAGRLLFVVPFVESLLGSSELPSL